VSALHSRSGEADEQPTLFKFVINRKTADALGLSIPPQLHVFADALLE
jgi:hypothetical protein